VAHRGANVPAISATARVLEWSAAQAAVVRQAPLLRALGVSGPSYQRRLYVLTVRSRGRSSWPLRALSCLRPLGCSQVLRCSEDTGMPTGTIARLLIDKGFGFIRDEGGIEHFFHRSSVRGAVFELLREGQRVEFTPEESAKGPRAGEIRLIED